MTSGAATPEPGPAGPGGTTTVPAGSDAFALLEQAASDAVDALRGLAFLAPSGVVELPVDARIVKLRIELPPGQFLHLQSIGIDADGVDDVAALTTVTASSWYGTYEERFDVARLLDFDHPAGTVLHTKADAPAWVELTFRRPIKVRRVRLRNVAKETARRARGIKVVATTLLRRKKVLYDGPLDLKALRSVMAPLRAAALADPMLDRLLPTFELTLKADYPAARKAFAALEGLDDTDRRRFREALNARLLPARQRLWTIHGPQRSFRFWSDAEKDRYLRFTIEVVEALRTLTPNVSLGFGSVLSAVRDKALIPHDDDLDVIVAFEPGEATTLAEGIALVKAHLEPMGFTVSGTYSAHRHVGKPGRKYIDVFVGLFEGEQVSWYPGARGALTRDMMFPTRDVPLLGVPVPVPAQPEAYCEAVYGPTWNVPNPNFAHKWDATAYSDISGRKPAATDAAQTATAADDDADGGAGPDDEQAPPPTD